MVSTEPTRAVYVAATEAESEGRVQQTGISADARSDQETEARNDTGTEEDKTTYSLTSTSQVTAILNKDVTLETEEEQPECKLRMRKRKRAFRAGDNFKLWRPHSGRTSPDGEVHAITHATTMSIHARRHECTHGDFRNGSYTLNGYDNNCEQVVQSTPHSFHQLTINEETRQSDPRNVSIVSTTAAALDRTELVTFTSGTTDMNAFRQHYKRARAEDNTQVQDPPAKRVRGTTEGSTPARMEGAGAARIT